VADIGNIKNFFVTWFDESDNYTTTSDITEDVLGISFTDTGSGQVNNCVLKLTGAFGNFITNSGGPIISITGGGGSGALGEAVVSGEVITFITVNNGGSGYTTVPTVTITGAGTGATATAILTNEIVTSITVNTGGSGYQTIPTVINQFDRFRVQAEDLVGNTYDRFFEFNPMIIPSQTKSEGTILELNLIGIEYHTQRVNFAGRFFFADAFTVSERIGTNYNKNIKIRQPILSNHDTVYNQATGVGNGFPKFTVNHYEYGMVEDSGYNRWQQMLDKLGGSVANGGVLDYFDCGFETSDVNNIEIALFSQGSRTVDISDDANIPTVIQPQSGDAVFNVNIGSTDVGIAAATATQVAAWGAQTHGSLPTGSSKYISGTLQFQFRPQWDSTIFYLKDSRVKFEENKHYKALNDITGTIPHTPPSLDTTNWEQIDMSDEFGDTIQYSEWTDDKVREWGNCGANPNAVTQTDGVVTFITLITGGSGYSGSATVSITGGGGSGATANAVVVGDTVIAIIVTNGGSGYGAPPNVIITDTGTGATARATVSSRVLTSEGACMFDQNIVILDPTPDAKFFRTWVDFILNDQEGKTIASAAANWAYNEDTDKFPVGRRMFIPKGSVLSITVTAGGADYSNNPTVTVTGGEGTDVSIKEVKVVNGVITDIVLDGGGTGFTSTPTVNIVDGTGAGATATALIATGSSSFTENDTNGIPFDNNISEWDGEQWIVKYDPTQKDVNLDTMQVVVIDEALVYQYTSSTTTWFIIGGDLATDCIHKYTTIEASNSFDPKPTITDNSSYPQITKDGATFSSNVKSELNFRYNVTETFFDRIAAGSDNPIGEYFSKGAWAVWRVPFSPNNYGTPFVTVGNLYGTDTPSIGEANLQPSFLDTQNMSVTSRGTKGFNQDNSEDLGQLQEVAFNIRITNRSLDLVDFDGITRVRHWMIDRYDNLAVFDFDVPFVNVSYGFKLPLSSYNITHGRKPRFFDLTINNAAVEFVPQELDVGDTFAMREIQLSGWQIHNFYDEFDRYAPDIINDLQDTDVNNTTLAKIAGGELALAIDNFHFTKPLLAIARQPGTDRNLEAQFRKRPHIITFQQLLNDAQTELEKEQFQLKQYEIETAGSEIFGLKFGDSYFFENNELVNDQDDSTDPTAKKIKLVVKNIQYSLTSPGTGEGGLTRKITSSRRFL